MPDINLRFISESGNRDIKVPIGTLVNDALDLAGIESPFPCGGAKLCGRCRVSFLHGAPVATDDEKRLLETEELLAGVRLACCSQAASDAEIRLDNEQGLRTEHVLDHGVRSDIVIDPEVTKYACILPASTLHAPISDWSRVVRDLPEAIKGKAEPTIEVLLKLPQVTARCDSEGMPATVTMRGNRMIDVECGNRKDELYGVAVDLGTTTIAAVLVDMRTGAEIAKTGRLNPQTSYGFDLISRIHCIQMDRSNLEEMHLKVVEAIGGLIEGMCAEKGIKPGKVSAMALAGNTVMSHLFLGIDPTSLGHAPFAGTLRAGVRLEARDLGLPILGRAPVYVLPCMGGFVGGDIVAGVLVTNLAKQKGTSVLVDIGTNGEVVVARDGHLWATSSAAGPAFEGVKISCGTMASDGAINHVEFDGEDLHFRTLGEQPIRGVCGSGLIETVQRSMEAGLLAANGRIAKPDSAEASRLSAKLVSRLHPNEEEPRIALSRVEDGGRNGHYLTQSDVREFQLGKAAVQAAVRMVLDEVGVSFDDIDRFLVAGAFGNHLNIRDAMAVGLLPELPEEKVFFIGNSSLEGARCVLLNRYERQRAEQIADMTKFVELASRPEFQDHFAMAMFLGPAMDF